MQLLSKYILNVKVSVLINIKNMYSLILLFFPSSFIVKLQRCLWGIEEKFKLDINCVNWSIFFEKKNYFLYAYARTPWLMFLVYFLQNRNLSCVKTKLMIYKKFSNEKIINKIHSEKLCMTLTLDDECFSFLVWPLKASLNIFCIIGIWTTPLQTLIDYFILRGESKNNYVWLLFSFTLHTTRWIVILRSPQMLRC